MQFSMLEAEDVGLYKFDVLSQRGLGKIREALDIIAYNQPEAPLEDIHNIQRFKEDAKIRAMLLEAKALGCFYVESPAMRMLMVKLKVATYLELVAASSIIRPGVSQSGMMNEYILRHRDPARRAKANPLLLEIMPETYGVMVYQEDVIKVAHYFAGLSLAEADVLRRGMSGKFRSRDEFTKVQQTFYGNCASRGYAKELIDAVWNQIASFAGYAFSKGHSASYAVESYQSLYLKAHFPLEYMTATVNNFGGYYRTEIYVHEARKYGAQIDPPCIQKGFHPCVLYGKRLILGFVLVEGLEVEVVRHVLEERTKHGEFKDFEDFLNRVRVPLDQLAILIRIGAFRSFGISRKQLLWRAHYRLYKAPVKSVQEGLFVAPVQDFVLPDFEEHPMELVFDQLDLLGFPLCNPFDLLSDAIPEHTPAAQIPYSRGRHIETYGYLVAVKKSKTSKGDYMYFGTFLDIHGDTLDTVHFPESGRKYPFQGKGIYRLKGVVSETFEYFSLEVGEMHKLRWMDDVRYREVGS
jgi:DNA polymerase-3 subunit alpha